MSGALLCPLVLKRKIFDQETQATRDLVRRDEVAAWNQFEGHLQDRIRRMEYLKQNGAGTRRDTKDVP